MRAPIALVAVCVTTSTALLLTACGGGSDSADKIQQSPSGSPSTSAAASASPSTSSAAADRPTITFPSDAHDVFEDQSTGDAAKDAILADNAHWVEAMDDAVFQGTTKTKALPFYGVGLGYQKALPYIRGFLDKGKSWTGTVLFFDRKVTLLSSNDAAVIYCSDESKAFPKDRKTGEVEHTAGSSLDYVLYNTDLKKNAQGVWQTDNVTSYRGDKQCQP
ncbi:hypothetical protein RVR_2954 [Actinacidiphila reveromycinica]|uniref:Lipoprotein n=1 Tax=Actinacidiphila reveromycinica TaxID=659352 RepID=A0A7U3URA4_9ACTN|nr:hypothetical protein [Streptomyces sp. SN-593]BBA97286.1 hypothetical protein RVR_2954 [Streptomyces sp. SN-593]